ncbi:hypothetical protein DC081_08990 [Ignatzschineria cameli]|nr:hypothetical protein DC081_08990 [Ignatzschineria cameli]
MDEDPDKNCKTCQKCVELEARLDALEIAYLSLIGTLHHEKVLDRDQIASDLLGNEWFYQDEKDESRLREWQAIQHLEKRFPRPLANWKPLYEED